jgi:paraquat-inducible protein A
MKKQIAIVLYLCSIILFILGLINPVLENSFLVGLSKKSIYLLSSIQYFFDEKEYFIGILILTFTVIFPIFKYIFIALRFLNVKFGQTKWVVYLIEIINKWAMLDVFVVALIIVNMKFNSLIISASIEIGTTFFAISVLLLMFASWILRKHEEESINMNY